MTDALPASDLDDPGAVLAHAIAPLEALSHLPAVAVTAAEAERILHGQDLPAPDSGVPSLDGVLLLTLGNRLLAVAQAVDGRIRPRKVFPGAGTPGP